MISKPDRSFRCGITAVSNQTNRPCNKVDRPVADEDFIKVLIRSLDANDPEIPPDKVILTFDDGEN